MRNRVREATCLRCLTRTKLTYLPSISGQDFVITTTALGPDPCQPCLDLRQGR